MLVLGLLPHNASYSESVLIPRAKSKRVDGKEKEGGDHRPKPSILTVLQVFGCPGPRERYPGERSRRLGREDDVEIVESWGSSGTSSSDWCGAAGSAHRRPELKRQGWPWLNLSSSRASRLLGMTRMPVESGTGRTACSGQGREE